MRSWWVLYTVLADLEVRGAGRYLWLGISDAGTTRGAARHIAIKHADSTFLHFYICTAGERRFSITAFREKWKKWSS